MNTKSADIYFFKLAEPYGAFSNFARYPIVVDGIRYPTTEHFFQAWKFGKIDNTYFNKIAQAPTPTEALKLGRTRLVKIRDDWEKVKVDVMMTALRAKFTQYPLLKAMLVETQGRKIVEQTERDSYWADGGDGTGQNMLGQCLMRLRDELILEAVTESSNIPST